jgi:SAM-dependent methyltransferase
MKNEALLERLRLSFQESARIENQGLSLASVLPDEILHNPSYAYFKKCTSYSGTPDIIDYFQPRKGHNYLDFGAFLNLERYHLYCYPWYYYGVEASPEIVYRMQEFILRRKIKNAGMFLSQGLELDFKASFFHCITCIGVLEYYPPEDSRTILMELCRVLKKRGKMILDIPNIKHEAFQLLCRMEAFLNREVQLSLSPEEFLSYLPENIMCHAMDESQVMVRFYLEKKA